jgi:hypothetical protein
MLSYFGNAVAFSIMPFSATAFLITTIITVYLIATFGISITGFYAECESVECCYAVSFSLVLFY